MSRYEKIEFEKFDEMVADHSSKCMDVKTPLAEMDYQAGGLVHLVADDLVGKVSYEAKLNQNGFNQLMARLSAPGTWISSGKCPADLEEHIVNRLKQDHAIKNSLFRFRLENINIICRAVLSNQYLPYNHIDMWGDVKNAIEGTRLLGLQPKIWKPEIKDYMDAWIIFEGANADPDNNPTLYDGGGAGGLKPAIHIKNSEDGTGKVSITSGMYRSYCTNGVIFGFKSDANLDAIHRGGSKHFMRTRVSLAIAEAAAKCQLGVRKFLEATTVEIKSDVIDDIVNDWAKAWKLSVTVSEEWSKAIARSRTWGDVVMATSDYAGTRSDREETTSLEEMAGAMLLQPVRRTYIQ